MEAVNHNGKLNGHTPKQYKYTKKTGRPSLYKPEYCEAIIKFFDIEPYKEVVTKRFTRKDGEISEFC